MVKHDIKKKFNLKNRKSRVFRVEFRVSKLEKSSFSSRVSSLSFKNSNSTRKLEKSRVPLYVDD
jgi:hypothetical protein